MMLDIKKYYLYCMGEGYLDKRRYSEDAAHEKMLNRVLQDNLDQTFRASQRAPLSQAREPQAFWLNLFPQPSWLQRAVLVVLKPVQVVIVFIRNLFQPPQPRPGEQPFKGAVLEKMMSQIFAFFFGNKKDKVDEKEKEKRFLEDFNDPEIWGKRVVESSNGSGFGGQR